MFSRSRLLQLADGMKGKRVVVYGDIVADRFIYGTPKRISREAPVLILRQYRDDVLPGGAGNAITNIFSLGGVPLPVSVLGSDSAGESLLGAMQERRIDCGGIVLSEGYGTPTKVRILGGMPHASRQQIVRYDIEDSYSMQEADAGRFATALDEALRDADAALISDYGYGAVTRPLVESLTRGAAGRPVTLDSRYDLLSYRGITAATPNEEEAAAAAGISLWNGKEDAINDVTRRLREALACEAVLVTRGSRGMALLEQDASEPLLIPVYGTDQVADVTGAGDTVIATFTLALAAGSSFAEAAKLANYAGGIVVMKMGTATVSREELMHAIDRDEELDD